MQAECVVVRSVGIKWRQPARRVLVIVVSVWPHYFSGHWHLSSSSSSAALLFHFTLHPLHGCTAARNQRGVHLCICVFEPDLVRSIWKWTIGPFTVIELGKGESGARVCLRVKRGQSDITSLGCVGYALYKGQRCLRCLPMPNKYLNYS